MRKIWLTFAQTTTVALAMLFVLSTLKPEWLPQRAQGAKILEVTQSAQTEGTAVRSASSYSDAVRRAAPAVVSILTSKEIKVPQHPFFSDPLFRRFFGNSPGEQSQRSSGLGSGVIVSPQGYILTNHHVIEAADEIEVALTDGKKLRAKIIGADQETDLAVLQVDGIKLPAITFGETDRLKVGDVVLAIGNPFGVGQTVTMGIVSALGRSGLQINTYENFIQTDAAINPGNSGGALTDAAGNLIGINTAIYSRTGGSLGIGFAIPASTARMVMEQIVASGSVTRGWIGVEAQEITPELAESFGLATIRGALIAGVLRGSPADKGGVKPGDILLSADSKPVTDPTAMLNIVAGLPPGRTVAVRVRRDQKEVELQVEVGKRPPPPRRRQEPGDR